MPPRPSWPSTALPHVSRTGLVESDISAKETVPYNAHLGLGSRVTDTTPTSFLRTRNAILVRVRDASRACRIAGTSNPAHEE